MKKKWTFVLALVAMLAGAQELQVLRTDGQVETYPLSQIDSLTFRADAEGLRAAGDLLRVHGPSGTTLFAVDALDSLVFPDNSHLRVLHRTTGAHTFNLQDVDSLSFADTPEYTVRVTYSEGAALVENPLDGVGLSAVVNGADVSFTAAGGLAGILYELQGASSNGMFKLYSDQPARVRLNGLDLTNPDGPPFNVQDEVTVDVELAAGSTNHLRDGATYAAAPNGEDQKAPLFSEGSLRFGGTGSLVITALGTAAHGLCSDLDLHVASGTLTLASAVKDGIHTNTGYSQTGGVVTVASTSDGIDPGSGPLSISGGSVAVTTSAVSKDGLKSGSTVAISGGVVQLTVTGNQSKGINAAEVLLTGGQVTATTSGNAVLVASGLGFDPSYCTAVKGDQRVVVDGCALGVTATGAAGRGISTDGTLDILSGSVTILTSGNGAAYVDPLGITDAYAGHCLNADGRVRLLGGTIQLTATGSAAKGVNGDATLEFGQAGSGPAFTVAVSGAQISIGGGEYAEAKAVSVDSLMTIDGGQLTLTSVDDALKSKTRIDMNQGEVTIVNTVEGLEAPIVHINGGTLRLSSTDDGINTTMGVDGEANDGSDLTINGGYLYLTAPQGDGMDSNGNMTVNGGTILIHGAGAQPEVGLDVNGLFRVTGSTLVVSQINSNMVETPSATSTQRCVMLRKTSGTYAAGTLVRIQDTAGTPLLTFVPARTYSNILFSSPAITSGASYQVYTGGTCTGTLQDGLYTGGTYSGGTLRASFSSTSMVQSVTF